MASVAPEGVVFPGNIAMLKPQELLGTRCRFHRLNPIEASGSIVVWLSAIHSSVFAETQL
jgi:hypothetical protein